MSRHSTIIAALVSQLWACSGDSIEATDAAPLEDAPLARADASPGQDASPALGWVDFTLQGCASGEGSEASPCIGRSPLELRFTALAPSPIESHAWSFGDGSETDTSESPVHRFEAPGSYDLRLNVEGPGGSAGVTRLAAVVVIPAALASPCSEDSHCASGDCVCAAPSSCPSSLQEGLCALDCDSHASCGGNVCIDMDPTGVGEQDWQRRSCLPPCTPGTGACPHGQSCQALADVEGGLSYVCFASGVLKELGAGCRNLAGELDSSLCASGLCLDLGDRGVCSSPCSDSACPAGSACASFADSSLTPHCLADCESFACDLDAQMSCQAPGDAFSVPSPVSAAGYCAPTP